MLTLDEVKNISFRRANFGGYKPEDVDVFIDEVQDSYEKLLAERESFISRVEELTKKLKDYEKEAEAIEQVIENAQSTAEKTLNEASEVSEKLIENAQNTVEKAINDASEESEKVVESAKEEAETMLNSAKKEFNEMMDAAKLETESQKVVTENLKIEATRIREELREIYRNHMERLERLPVYDRNPQKVMFGSGDFEVSGGRKKPLPDEVFTRTAGRLPAIVEEELAFGRNYQPEEEAKISGVYNGILRKW